MTSQDLIEKIRITTFSLSDILNKLEDRNALALIGVSETDVDESTVEDAIYEIKNSIQEYSDEALENGTVEYFGKQYALMSNPELTNGYYTGCHSIVSDGEQYISEWSCPAIGNDGLPYRVIWCWPAVKGNETENTRNVDWGAVEEIHSSVDVTVCARQKTIWLEASSLEGKSLSDWIYDVVEGYLYWQNQPKNS